MFCYGLRISLANGFAEILFDNHKYSNKTVTANYFPDCSITVFDGLLEYIDLFLRSYFHRETFSLEERLSLL